MSNLTYINRSDGQTELLVSQTVKDSLVKNLYIYSAEGLILAVVNFSVLFTILFYTILRTQKEFIIVSGLSLVNGCHGVALIVAAVGRICLIESGNGK
uniref:Uncharacterized protein n=1 Tax=Plectus sambesii TaxID=2011161 RepID=A0A914VE06_9BILA